MVLASDRDARNGAYAIRIRDRVEADEELKGLCADMLKERGVSGITLEERLILELKFFKETGQHLDITNITICSGSRCSNGRVPEVFWDDDELRVSWYFPGGSDDGLRSRQVVS